MSKYRATFPKGHAIPAGSRAVVFAMKSPGGARAEFAGDLPTAVVEQVLSLLIQAAVAQKCGTAGTTGGAS